MFLFSADVLEEYDRRRLAVVYEKYSGRMYTAAKRILNNGEDAEDAVQNAFYSIAKRMNNIDIHDENALCGYLLTVVKNEAIEILRKRKNAVPVDELTDLTDSSDTVFETEKREVFEYAVKIIMRMDETYRAPLYLTAVMGYTSKETSKILKRSEATVRVQISRAKKMLAKQLKEAGYEL
ncbi:MAG: sigma-70 family RNA polymerase sigma factor [Clostridia bacterium]|nr:sigma-70 family RNA polymerase sigma factor [Clostridia bacterium]